jgi:phage gp16-like protein
MSVANYDQRRRDLAVIHMAVKQLGIDDDAYRDMLFAIARVRSARDLNHEGRQAVLAHLKKSGFRPRGRGTGVEGQKSPRAGWEWVNAAAPDRQPMLWKIRRLLVNAGRDRAYVDGIIAQNGYPRLEFCDAGRLHALIAALNYDARRRTKAP